jgi:hypothetical protein
VTNQETNESISFCDSIPVSQEEALRPALNPEKGFASNRRGMGPPPGGSLE